MSAFDTCFDYKSKHLPAKRYKSFVSLLEEKIKSFNEQMNNFKTLQPLYELISSIMEEENLPNNNKIHLYENCINIDITSLPEDTQANYKKLALKIGTALLQRQEHSDGIPSQGYNRSWPGMYYIFWLTNANANIQINVELPPEGLDDLDIIRTETQSTTTISHYEYTSY
jgi:hypothetical protein